MLVGGAAAASRWRGEDSRFWDIVEVLGWVAHAGGAGVVAAHGFAVRGVCGGRVMMMIRAREEGGEAGWVGRACFALRLRGHQLFWLSTEIRWLSRHGVPVCLCASSGCLCVECTNTLRARQSRDGEIARRPRSFFRVTWLVLLFVVGDKSSKCDSFFLYTNRTISRHRCSSTSISLLFPHCRREGELFFACKGHFPARAEEK